VASPRPLYAVVGAVVIVIVILAALYAGGASATPGASTIPGLALRL